MWTTAGVVLICVALSHGQQPGVTQSRAEIWPDTYHLPPAVVSSPSYPLPMRPNTIHEITINTIPNSVINLQCTEILLNGPCQWANVTVIDGDMAGALCASHRNFQIDSQSATLILVIFSGPYGESRLNCIARASLRGPVPSYLVAPSVEINSSEFGVKPGSKATTCPCGWSNKRKSTSRIVGGEEAEVNEYPLAVSLIEISNRKADSFGYMQFCGGTIISPWHVLTAAHCTLDYLKDPKRELGIIVGDHDHTKWDESTANVVVMIDKIIVHEQYSSKNTQYDISLLKTKTQIQFSDKVGPACLPKGPLNLQGQYVKGVGWGMTSVPGGGSNVLKKVWIRVLPLNTCSPVYPGSINLSNKHQMCVFGKQRGLCMGDSGGPVIWVDPATNRYTIVGVTSFGRSCSDFYPDVVTDVSSFLPWIKSKIAATTPAQTCSAV